MKIKGRYNKAGYKIYLNAINMKIKHRWVYKKLY